jgi:hypothetical protein
LRTSIEPPIGLVELSACCAEYAVDTQIDGGLVYANLLATAQETCASLSAGLIAGREIALQNGTNLKRQHEVVIPLAAGPDGGNPGQDQHMTRYRAAYVRTPPQRIVTGVGYELCIVHRDAVMQDAKPTHFAYALRFAEDTDDIFRARFLYLWGRATGLPCLPEWRAQIWRLGRSLGLIVPLTSHACEGWRIDPRGDLPDGRAGWRKVLETIVQLGADWDEVNWEGDLNGER